MPIDETENDFLVRLRREIVEIDMTRALDKPELFWRIGGSKDAPRLRKCRVAILCTARDEHRCPQPGNTIDRM